VSAALATSYLDGLRLRQPKTRPKHRFPRVFRTCASAAGRRNLLFGQPPLFWPVSRWPGNDKPASARDDRSEITAAVCHASPPLVSGMHIRGCRGPATSQLSFSLRLRRLAQLSRTGSAFHAFILRSSFFTRRLPPRALFPTFYFSSSCATLPPSSSPPSLRPP
jgi:hypothetical protein